MIIMRTAHLIYKLTIWWRLKFSLLNPISWLYHTSYIIVNSHANSDI